MCRHDAARRDDLNGAIAHRRAAIDSLLAKYHVPRFRRFVASAGVGCRFE